LYVIKEYCRTLRLKFTGKDSKNQILIQEKVKRILNSSNTCYHSVQRILSSRLLFKNFACDSVWVRNLVSDIKGGT
jgi:hypothetical protein